MGRKRSMLLSCTSLLFIFMLTTVFFYLVYNRFYDSVSDDFIGFFLFPNPNQSDTSDDMTFESLKKDLDQWAKEHHAILFFRGASAAGIATVDYAGWIQENWHIPFDGTGSKTVIVSRENEHINSYIDGDILFPDSFHYRIVGEFERSKAPIFQQEAFFYYPLAESTNVSGVLFTNQTDKAALRSLTDVIAKSGREADYQTFTDQRVGIFEAIFQMLHENFISRSLIFAFLGLIFCAVFAISMMYRESNRYLKIHHLFGARYWLLYVQSLIPMALVAFLGTFVGYLLASTQLHLLHQSAYLRIALLAGMCHMIFLIPVQTFYFLNWKRNDIEKVGR